MVLALCAKDEKNPSFCTKLYFNTTGINTLTLLATASCRGNLLSKVYCQYLP